MGDFAPKRHIQNPARNALQRSRMNIMWDARKDEGFIQMVFWGYLR